MDAPRRWLAGAIVALAASPALGEAPRYGVSLFGELKYGADFKHFDYVNPTAPKGGRLRLHGIDSFDNLNPFILKGVPAVGLDLTFDTLMTPAMDEPDSFYGLVAENVELADDRSWIAFNLRPEARFHDGTPITADDVVFTFKALVEKGHPRYRLIYGDVARAEAVTPHRVRFVFKPGQHRDLPISIAGLPVLSKAYYSRNQFDTTTVHPPLGSGPYRVRRMEIGRTILYRREVNYWARDLPVNRGRYNFDRIRFDYYRDRGIALEAFFAGEFDWREEFTSRAWATQYDKPPVRDGFVVRETLPDETPSGVQAFFFNLRREKFRDRRVRAALNYAFDFEWTNRRLFYDLYRRTNSMFENSPLAAHDAPSPAELALLEPLRGKIPDEVFKRPYVAPRTDGSGKNRKNLLTAARLLRDAGWTIRDGVRVNARGEPLEIEFLLAQSSFQRIINPYIRHLKRLGIQGRIRIVDASAFQQRRRNYDFDVVMNRFVQPLSPGIEQRNFFGSEAADEPGSRNLAGIRDPAVDYLIDKVTEADSRAALITAVRALDRVLMWNHYAVPHWFKGAHNIAYWNKFGRPKVKPRFDLGVLDTWWFDAKKAAMIEAGKAPPRPPGALKTP